MIFLRNFKQKVNKRGTLHV